MAWDTERGSGESSRSPSALERFVLESQADGSRRAGVPQSQPFLHSDPGCELGPRHELQVCGHAGRLGDTYVDAWTRGAAYRSYFLNVRGD